MFLHDLYRREEKEDFLTTALAELLRRDDDALRSVLPALGLSDVPAAFTRKTIRTQVVLTDRLRTDLWIDLRSPGAAPGGSRWAPTTGDCGPDTASAYSLLSMVDSRATRREGAVLGHR